MIRKFRGKLLAAFLFLSLVGAFLYIFADCVGKHILKSGRSEAVNPQVTKLSESHTSTPISFSWRNVYGNNIRRHENEMIYSIRNWTYDFTSTLCKPDKSNILIQDLFCWKRPKLLTNYKNPCWEVVIDDKTEVRCMPYFHLLGADKCGSTDLFDRILRHPEMEGADCNLQKECYYWSWSRTGVWMKQCQRRVSQDGFESYLSHFNKAAMNIAMQQIHGYHSHITGEGTPMDFWDFRGWQRIKQNKGFDEPWILTPHHMRHVYQNPKFLIILREPADRLYSDYYFLRYGTSPEKFHRDAVNAVHMMKSCLVNQTLRHCIFSCDMYKALPMRIHVSCYSVFIREWFAVFPREAFHVLRNEDYGRDIGYHMNQVFQFLNISTLSGVQMAKVAEKKRKHVTARKRGKGPMLNETRKLLKDFFAPFNEDLATLLHDKRFLWNDVD